MYCITQFGTIGTIVLTARLYRLYCGIKIDYKNCASRWSLTQSMIVLTTICNRDIKVNSTVLKFTVFLTVIRL